MLEAGFIRPCRYAEWISSVVPMQKKDGQWRVCVDFRDLNRATPKDEYPMPVAETLINAAASRKILSFMDGNAGYNQIFMAPEDVNKTAFIVPGAVGLFEYMISIVHQQFLAYRHPCSRVSRVSAVQPRSRLA
jgi:hypothetical protein